MKTLILVDSSITNLQEIRKINNVKILPLVIRDSNGKEYFEEILDLTPEYLNKEIDKKLIFKTSCTPIGYSEEVIQESFKEYENIIVLTISKGWSSQYSYLKNLEKKYDRLFVCDTSSYGFSLEYSVYKIIEQLEQNKSIEEIVNFVNDLKNRSIGFFAVKNLIGITNSGRIPKVISKLLKLVKIYPIIRTEEDNKKETFVKKWENSYEKMLDSTEELMRKNNFKVEDLTILLSDNSLEEIEKFKEVISKRLNISKELIKTRTAPMIFYPTVCSGAIGIQFIFNNK